MRSARVHKSLKRMDAVELVPEVYDCFSYFHKDGNAVLADPRIRRFVDDGRNFLLMRPEKYDVITVDPAPPIWSAGTVNLYSREFFVLCKEHLNQGGVMSLWLPPAAFAESAMIMSTFVSVFPNAYVFGGPVYPGLYLLGFQEGSASGFERFQDCNFDPAILADINEWGKIFPSPASLSELMILSPEQFSTLFTGEPIITDDHPYTEFPLWRALFDSRKRILMDARLLRAIRDQVPK